MRLYLISIAVMLVLYGCTVEERYTLETLSSSVSSISDLDITAGASPSDVHEVTITNEGELESERLAASLTNTTNFELYSNGCDGVSLNSGESCTIQIRAKARTTESYSGSLVIAGRETITIPLSGSADGFLPFTTTWQTANAGTSANNQITLPLTEDGSYNFTVDWGDGSSSIITSWDQADKTHTYAASGNYTVTMTGTFSRFIFANAGDEEKLTDISTWGTSRWESMQEAFYGCTNLNITAVDAPDLSNVTNMISMFQGATSLNSDISHWDTSNVIYIGSMFEGAAAFNQPIGSWDISNVTGMSDIFLGATNFNQDLSNWNTSKVIYMDNIFKDAVNFNQPIGGWDVSNVTGMYQMFSGATNFNQNISNWNTSKVIYMGGMFKNATSFNQPIGGWDVSNVTGMNSMFLGATNFNQNISSWDTSNVTNIGSMFKDAVNFNQPIGSWNISKVAGASNVFHGATSFNQPLGAWDTSNILNMSYMFRSATAFNQDISSWNTARATNMDSMFRGATSFNRNLSGWNVDNVTNSANFSTGATAWVLAQPAF